jgi:hypothetical protein
MKETLEFAGALLYIIFCIVVFPLLIVTHCLIEAIQALSYINAHKKQWGKLWRKKTAFHLPRYINLAVARIKSFHF